MHFPILRAVALFVSIILGGVIVFVFDFYELNSPAVNTGLLLVITTLKVLYFLGATLHCILGLPPALFDGLSGFASIVDRAFVCHRLLLPLPD
jgi:hypothetical protein